MGSRTEGEDKKSVSESDKVRKDEVIKPSPLAIIGYADNFRGSRFYKSKKAVIVMLALLLLLGALAFYLNSSREDSTSYKPVCSDATIVAASTAIDANDIPAVGKLKREIEEKADYKRDHNCLFILARHSLMLRDLEGVRSYLPQLKTIYASQKSYSNNFTTPTYPPQKLEEIIAKAEDDEKFRQQQIEENSKARRALDEAADKAGGGGER